MKDIVLATENLKYVYSPGLPFAHVAIDGISVAFERGELVGIIGHTGSGKSTLVQHFNGLLKAASGRVLLDGKDIWAPGTQIKDVRFKVGVCFQYPEHQLFEETVYKDIAFGPKNMGLSAEEIDCRVREVIAFVGLDESYLEKSPFDLSGGEKRRVAIAGVMAMKPEVLILDEPCAGLDPAGRDMLLSLIKSYRETTGSTVLFVSHSMDDIAKLASKVLVLNGSHVAMYGTVDEVFSHGDELVEMGLNVPVVTQILNKLKARGLDIKTSVYDVEGAAQVLANLAKGGQANA